MSSLFLFIACLFLTGPRTPGQRRKAGGPPPSWPQLIPYWKVLFLVAKTMPDHFPQQLIWKLLFLCLWPVLWESELFPWPRQASVQPWPPQAPQVNGQNTVVAITPNTCDCFWCDKKLYSSFCCQFYSHRCPSNQHLYWLLIFTYLWQRYWDFQENEVPTQDFVRQQQVGWGRSSRSFPSVR